MSKAYDQLASTLRSVKESAAQLDKVEDLLKYLLLHRQHMAEWKHIKYAHTALLSMTDHEHLFMCQNVVVSLSHRQHMAVMMGVLRCMLPVLTL